MKERKGERERDKAKDKKKRKNEPRMRRNKRRNKRKQKKRAKGNKRREQTKDKNKKQAPSSMIITRRPQILEPRYPHNTWRGRQATKDERFLSHTLSLVLATNDETIHE